MFLWQMTHERLATNLLRAKRGLTHTATCPFECLCEETTLHIMRDCERTRKVWASILNPNLLSRFFSVNLQCRAGLTGIPSKGQSSA